MGHWPEALQTYREAAEARAQALLDHPDTLSARYEVGISLGRARSQRAGPGAVPDPYRRPHPADGPAHPETLRARQRPRRQPGPDGALEEALAESRDVWAIRERVLGPEHPDTLVSRREVARSASAGWAAGPTPSPSTGVATARERVLGADHPDALASRNDEAHCLEQLGRGQEAVELHRRVSGRVAAGTAGRGGASDCRGLRCARPVRGTAPAVRLVPRGPAVAKATRRGCPRSCPVRTPCAPRPDARRVPAYLWPFWIIACYEEPCLHTRDTTS